RHLEHDGKFIEVETVFQNVETGFTLDERVPKEEKISSMDTYASKVQRSLQRGCVYPYEIIKMLVGGYKDPLFGSFEEYDIIVDRESMTQEIISVKNRPWGINDSNVVFGLIQNSFPDYDAEIRRVIILSDPSTDLGSLAEGECRRIIAAIDLAERNSIPVEWIPVSSGARIDMDSGTENLDWTAAVLKRIVDFTQRGGEINIIVSNINVGAQSYWNSESTMLMHCSGLLIMTEEGSMLLTGKKALDFSGSISAEDSLGIGGVLKIMGPNGQCQLKVRDLIAAYKLLFKHYRLTRCCWKERLVSPYPTKDPRDRDVTGYPYVDQLSQGFKTVGDIFAATMNPERKKPFDIRQVMMSVIDQDQTPLARWKMMKDALSVVVWETMIGGLGVGLIGIESKSIKRFGHIPNDGPDNWTGGTLFPLSSKKLARAINSFSNKIPLVVLANLSGFDGSPESLRNLQLEYGAEIGRAIVNFAGPIVFIVISRYHGGAYVVFSKRLNPSMRVAAIRGSYASVIGGAPAAAVVFPRMVQKNAYRDERIIEARKQLEASNISKIEYEEIFDTVYNEHKNRIADKFDSIHSVERAKKVGSIDDIIEVSELRPYICRILEESLEGRASLRPGS
ncbi:MAG: hypothetical protein HQK54_12440, partial [Oligoflexales bacterium]|nr:hypothetical protein [Oligoflexales bacterium]